MCFNGVSEADVSRFSFNINGKKCPALSKWLILSMNDYYNKRVFMSKIFNEAVGVYITKYKYLFISKEHGENPLKIIAEHDWVKYKKILFLYSQNSN